MPTRSSSNLVGESSPNPTSSNTKRHNSRLSKQPFILEESPAYTMDDQYTTAELLRAPTEGYAEAIVVPPILAYHFELKHSLINMMTLDQFFRLEKDDPHDHIRCEFFPPSRTTNIRNEIFNFQQRFDESFHKAWDHYKYLIRTCPHHGFTKLHRLDTFYNSLNPVDQDSLNSAAGGNLLERRTQDVLRIIKNKSKIAKLTDAVNQQTSAVTTAMTAILKQFQATPPPASVKSVKEICVSCGGAHLLVLDGPSVPMPPPFINPEEDGRVEETLTDQDLAEYTIKVPPPFVQKAKPTSQRNYVKMLKSLFSNKEKLLDCQIHPSMKIAQRDVFVLFGKFTFPVDFVIVDYEGGPIVSLILGIPFLWTTHAIIDVYAEEMILHDVINPLSGSITSSSSPNHLLKEFADELALITFPLGNDDLPFDIEFDLRVIEYLLIHDPTKEMDSTLAVSVDEENLADPNNNLFDTIPEMFIDEHALDYSSPSLYDDYDDDLDELESNNDDA
uniref:Retrotransposon gag domain-containing protein n=1 Tax=Tanacetum cinerariifolium TaxID=118510 RepID=A0A6L2K099_TANCI|nr:hypothetical protein [Tanacetum cinerariifolium]